VTLRDYFDSRLESVEKATELAAKTLEKRLEGMNEFREALNNQATMFATRSEVDIQIKKFEKQIEKTEDDIRMLRESKAMLEGKASHLYVTITLVVALLGLFVSFMSMITRIRQIIP
jgi:prefoldin subunit 5